MDELTKAQLPTGGSSTREELGVRLMMAERYRDLMDRFVVPNASASTVLAADFLIQELHLQLENLPAI